MRKDAFDAMRAEVLAPFSEARALKARRDYSLRIPGVCCVCGRELLGRATVCTASSPCRKAVRA